MTEPTITCPKCKTEIKLTESLAAPLIEATHFDCEQPFKQKYGDSLRQAVAASWADYALASPFAPVAQLKESQYVV